MMADKRLIDFQANDLPRGDDIIYFGDQSDSFRETRTTLDQEREYTPQYVRLADQDVTQLFMGKNVINGSASPITFTIPQGAAFPITSQFNMIRNGTGAFTLTAAPGVTLNGVDGGSVTLAQQYDRLVATEILADEWTFVEYSGALGVINRQNVYDNSADGNIDLIAGKPITFTSSLAGFRLPSMTEAEFQAIPTPLNGEKAWDEVVGREIVNKGTPGSPVYDHNAYVSDVAATLGPVYGEMYFQGNGTATTIVAQSTPVKIAGTYVDGKLASFTHANGTLTFIGVDPREFQVNVSTTATLNQNTAGITVLIAKNGTVIAESGQSPDLDGVSPSFLPISLNKFVNLSTNDTIEVWTQNNSLNNEDITHQDLSVTVGSPGLAGAVSKNNNLFTQLQNEVKVENTAAETTIKGTGVGSMFFPANSLSVGDTFEFVLAGSIQNSAAGQLINFKVVDGSNFLFNTGLISLKSMAGLTSYTLKAVSTVQNTGIFGVGRVRTIVELPKIVNNIDSSVILFSGQNSLNTTIDINYDVTVQWGAASPNNIVTSNLISFRKI
jgi:hypothetical protein